jgi:hypothetical protein
MVKTMISAKEKKEEKASLKKRAIAESLMRKLDDAIQSGDDLTPEE